jgi:hypothetical protein
MPLVQAIVRQSYVWMNLARIVSHLSLHALITTGSKKDTARKEEIFYP